MVYSARWLKVWVVVFIAVSMVLACTVVLAQGKVRSDEPLGWQKGEKKGWKGVFPLGSRKRAVGCHPG